MKFFSVWTATSPPAFAPEALAPPAASSARGAATTASEAAARRATIGVARRSVGSIGADPPRFAILRSLMQALYFAYGSNLASRRLLRRVPGARARGRARLAGFRLVADK